MAHLSHDEIGVLDGIFLRAYRAVDDLRAEAPVGRALHAVKVPPRLSESIVAANCIPLFGPEACVLVPSAPHDLAVRTRTRRRLNVAVKGSGLTDWAVITPTDRLAGVLIWVDYHDRLLDHEAPVIIRRIPIERIAAIANRAFLGSISSRCPQIRVWPGEAIRDSQPRPT
jgi:hypothetical protein